MTLTCSKCKQKLSVEAFYSYDLNRCKKCKRKYSRIYYRKHRDEYVKRRQTEKGIIAHRTTIAKWAKVSYYKQRAKKILGKAIRYGRIKREPCIVCGNPKSEGHHENYRKPLDVIWLCHKHHMLRHRK